MARTVDVAACTFLVRPVRDFEEFADHVREHLDRASGADIVVFPESFTTELLTTVHGWKSAPLSESSQLTEFTERYTQLFHGEASRRDQYILAGSHLADVEGVIRNASFLFGPDGLVHRHDKTHITAIESEWDTVEGNVVEVVELPFAKVGITICYEVEIPELPSSLAHQGAEILLCPAFTLTEAGFWRVRHCAAARAIENQVYMVHCGTGGDRLSDALPGSWARSSVLSPCDAPWPAPNGVLAEQEAPNTEAVVRATLDLDLLHENRLTGAARTFNDRHRRAAWYGSLPSPRRHAVG